MELDSKKRIGIFPLEMIMGNKPHAHLDLYKPASFDAFQFSIRDNCPATDIENKNVFYAFPYEYLPVIKLLKDIYPNGKLEIFNKISDENSISYFYYKVEKMKLKNVLIIILNIDFWANIQKEKKFIKELTL